jgi:hypothetical protein
MNPQIFTEAGRALYAVQIADKTIINLLRLVYPDEKIDSVESHRKSEEKLSKATLGPLIDTLKKRVNIEPEFDDILNDYLKNRNTFVHDWSRIPDWENESALLAHIKETQTGSTIVFYTLMGAYRDWIKKNKLESIGETDTQLDALFSEIDKNWVPISKSTIKKRANKVRRSS